MTELQTGESGKVCWKWQQKGPHSLRVSHRAQRRARWKKSSSNRWWHYHRKQTQSNNVLLLHARLINTKETLDTVNAIMKLPAACSITQHLLQHKWKRGTGRCAWFRRFSFLNISINVSYFNIFPASVHTLSPQDWWCCHSIRQTDESNLKECIFLFRLINRDL